MPASPPTVIFDDLPAQQITELIGHLQDIFFFAKDTDGRFIAGNQNFLARFGFKSVDEMIGQNDYDIFPRRMADKFREDDRKIMRTGQPKLDIAELFPNASGKPELYTTHKFPLRDRAGATVGICGVIQSLQRTQEYLRPFIELEDAAKHIRDHYADKLDIQRLAQMSHLSVRQFERRFSRVFQVSPRKYHMQTRIVEASRLLRDTRLSISQIAQRVGFYDHSAFARQFQSHMGESATNYRKRLES
ncbi:MAG: helix-turn-helix domain-containing protein [Planctomycetota bacterium]